MAAINQESNGENGVVSRRDIEAAMAKAVELRALHASLLQGKSSPLSRHATHFSAQDYPVFTPVCTIFYSLFFSFTHHLIQFVLLLLSFVSHLDSDFGNIYWLVLQSWVFDDYTNIILVLHR